MRQLVVRGLRVQEARLRIQASSQLLHWSSDLCLRLWLRVWGLGHLAGSFSDFNLLPATYIPNEKRLKFR